MTDLRISGAGAAQRGSGFVATLRVSALLAAALLSACAAPAKKPPLEAWPEYKVSGSVGLVINPTVTPIKVLAANSEDAIRLESAAEKKRHEASMGVGATALTVLTAPLAILAPLYPPAIQLAALPFMAADATAKAREDAERLQHDAAKARQDLEECGNRLAATYPELTGKFREALSEESFRQTLQEEMRSALQEHADLPVVSLSPREEMSFAPFLGEASRHQLQSVLEIEIHSLDLSTEETGGDAGDCGYKIFGDVKLQWWDVGNNLVVYRAGSLLKEGKISAELVLYRPGPLHGEGIDLPALVDRPEQFRSQVAKWFRNAVLKALNSSKLKFP